jgi:hypothetical protein
MRPILAVMLLAFAVGCSRNPEIQLTPHERLGPLVGIPLAMELDVTVVDTLGQPIEGAEVILQTEPTPRRITTPASGVVRFVGIFTVDPRFLIACAPDFVCSAWIDREAPGFGSLQQVVTLHRSTDPRIRFDVDAPSSDLITYVEGERVRVRIPSNWRELPGSNAVTFAPEGAYGNAGIKSIFTHGLAMGLARNDKRNLCATTDDFIDAYVLDHRGAVSTFLYDDVMMGQRSGLHATVATVSEASGTPEAIDIFTTLLDEETMFYVLAVVPRDAAARYAGTFRDVVASIEFIVGDAASSTGDPRETRPPLDCQDSRARVAARRR